MFQIPKCENWNFKTTRVKFKKHLNVLVQAMSFCVGLQKQTKVQQMSSPKMGLIEFKRLQKAKNNTDHLQQGAKYFLIFPTERYQLE